MVGPPSVLPASSRGDGPAHRSALLRSPGGAPRRTMPAHGPAMPRVLLVSNRLPVTLRQREGAWRATPSVGGLATGLAGPHAASGGLWFGWRGNARPFDPAERERLDRELLERGP